ncbi:MAG: hypothetical protein GWN01_05435 [Nitrosopumilaceae archaeon]|nr:hypothetical protein [Nitrosopumilaceae archaeon]NIU86788.1 hypothetical protein [Nitrosopumilaceae archaeon]NIX60988.1 hypothetical protein [Nitrosopumilaceae archaeon]
MAQVTTYNGFTNWDTWDLALWLNNDEGIYNHALNLNLEELKTFAEKLLKDDTISDEIDLNKVDWNEVKLAVQGY